MNSTKFQDARLIYINLLFLYTNNEISEKESKKKSCLKSHQKNKIATNKLNQGGERPIH